MSSKIYGNTIPRDWTNFNIGKDAFVKARIGWQSLRAQEYLDAGNYALVTGTDFSEGIINWNACQYVSKWRYDQDIDIQLKENDVLVTKDGTIGKIGLVKNLPCPATLNSGIYVIRPKSANVNPKFLFYMFMSKYFDDFIRVISAGSTITHLYQKDFVNFSFPLPPKAEQDRIAQVLGDIDDLISAKCELLDKKRAIKQGAAQQLLTPKPHWHTATLGGIFTFLKGKGLSKEKLNSNGKFKCILYGELYTTYNEVIDSIESSTNCEEGIKSKFDDLLIPASTTTSAIDLAKASVVLQCEILIGGDINILRKKRNDVSGKFMAYYLTSTKKIEIAQYAQGITIIHLYAKNLSDLEISYPSLLEQTKIAEILSDMDKEISALQDEIEKLKMIKQGAMDELLSGKIRLKR
ncbi:restriction endonuclease subunit S [Campylobacter curvus]|uniref:restriction endonuclease subunit S n=1 Tax=Campylobacter curvus TaxID=200 RepID=UPI00146FDEB2|nr:restriction endonuclease subunit S [Campylobacter curvus]MBN7288332.1 restriction endonuclease subunit S [Campylobacter curvus]